MASFTGGNGPDVYDGPDGEVNFINGANGDDRLTGGFLLDSINGGKGADTIFGLYGGDLLFGGDGDDSISGGADDDEIHDGKGSDTVDGGRGDDFIDLTLAAFGDLNVARGAAGDDTLRPGIGADRLDGGRGLDVVDYSAGRTGVAVDLATGLGSRGAAGDTYDSIEDVIGSRGADLLSGDFGVNWFDGRGGDDTLMGGRGSDTLDGSSGDDFVDGGPGADLLRGGAGIDTLIYRNTGNVRMSLVTGGIVGDAAGDVAVGFENLQGGKGSDWFDGNANANLIEGGYGIDYLYGGDGGDTLNGGEDSDYLYGQGGADVFLFEGEWEDPGIRHDRIFDFEDGSDLLQVVGLGFQDFTVEVVDVDSDGAADDLRLVHAASGRGIDLIEVAESEIDAADFAT